MPDDVVLFVRTLTSRIAGGTRAVIARANMLAKEGHRVTLVVTGLVDDRGARAYDSGLLDRRVRIVFFWESAPRQIDRAASAGLDLLEPPRVPAGPGITRRRRTTQHGERVRTYLDDRLLTQETLDPATRSTRSFITYDDEGRRSSVWSYVGGRPVVIDHPTSQGGRVRHFVVDGRLVWLKADISGTEGTGPASYPARTRSLDDYASALAEWLDDEFRDAASLVVFADGENVWQRSLRQMKHPRVRGVSVLHNSHLDHPYDGQAPTKPHWSAYFEDLRNIDLMVCLTARQKDDLLERYPGLPLRVVHHAAQKPPRQLPRRSSNRVVFVGRIAPQKQLEHLLDAFVDVSRRVPDAHLDIYGEGPEESLLRERVQSLGIDGRVTFHGPTEKPLEAFASARLALMTSLHEGLPLTLTEGMSVGTPFVAYDCRYGPSEVVRDGSNGYLVPPGDVKALADRTVDILVDDALARRLSSSARRVRRDFSPQRYRHAWLSVVDDVMARANVSHG